MKTTAQALIDYLQDVASTTEYEEVGQHNLQQIQRLQKLHPDTEVIITNQGTTSKPIFNKRIRL